MSKWIVRCAAIAAVFELAGAGRAEGQIFTPSFQGPRQSSDVGVYLSDGPGDFAVEGIWRRGFGGFDLGLRAGVADSEELSFLIGADYRNPLPLGGAPLDIAVTAAGQGLIGDFEGFGLAAGLSVGHTFAMPGLSFTPFIHPQLGFFDAAGSEDLDLIADFGLDIQATPRVDLRFGFGLDSRADWGVGFAWR